MRSNATIQDISLESLPTEWDAVLTVLATYENKYPDQFWKTLVAAHITAVQLHDSSEANYKELFRGFWEKDRPRIVNNPDGLIIAAECGFDVYMQKWLTKLSEPERVALVNQAFASGDTALHIATKYNDLLTMEVLLKNGADINAKGFLSYTPLHYAVYYHFPDAIEYLLKAGASYQEQSHDKDMPIHLAAVKGDINAINILLKHDPAQLNYISKEGRTPFYRAAMSANTDAMQVLLSHGVDINQINAFTKYGVLHLAAINNNVEVIQFMVQNGAKINLLDGGNFTPLQRAARQANPSLEAAKALIAAGADVNAGNPPPLYILAEQVDEETVSSRAIEFATLLLQHGAKLDPKSYGESVFDTLTTKTPINNKLG